MNLEMYDGTQEGHIKIFKDFFKDLIKDGRFPIKFENTTEEERLNLVHIQKVCGTNGMKRLFKEAYDEVKK